VAILADFNAIRPILFAPAWHGDTGDTRDTRDTATPRSMAGGTLWRHSGCGDTAPATPGQMEAEL